MRIKGNTESVHFDFDGALQLARQLWRLADGVSGTDNRRRISAETALVGFEGTYAQQFIERCSDENIAAARVRTTLRGEAMQCARLWKEAMDEQNRRVYARHVDDLDAKRSNWEKFGDIFTGFELPPKPNDVAIPHAPAFVPTASSVRYAS